MYVHSDVAVLVAGRLTRMQAHPDPDRDTARPVMAGQSTLRRYAAAHRIAGRLEHDEKTVALGPQLPAAAGAESGAQQGALGRQCLSVAVTEAAQQRRRPLDVAEEQRHGPRRKPPHPSIITASQETAVARCTQPAHVAAGAGTREYWRGVRASSRSAEVWCGVAGCRARTSGSDGCFVYLQVEVYTEPTFSWMCSTKNTPPGRAARPTTWYPSKVLPATPITGRSAACGWTDPSSGHTRRVGDLAAPISSGSAAGASQSCRQIQLKDHETLHTYSLPGIVMCVRNALLSA